MFNKNNSTMKKFLFTLFVISISLSAFSQKEHFGLILGSSYNVEEIGRDFRSLYGDCVDYGGSGDFYHISFYCDYNKEGATFGMFTIDFYKGRFWKVYYKDIQNDPNEFARKLERKFGDYSISATEYEYKYGNIYIEFDGDRLRYVNRSVSKSMLGY